MTILDSFIPLSEFLPWIFKIRGELDKHQRKRLSKALKVIFFNPSGIIKSLDELIITKGGERTLLKGIVDSMRSSADDVQEQLRFIETFVKDKNAPISLTIIEKLALISDRKRGIRANLYDLSCGRGSDNVEDILSLRDKIVELNYVLKEIDSVLLDSMG